MTTICFTHTYRHTYEANYSSGKNILTFFKQIIIIFSIRNVMFQNNDNFAATFTCITISINPTVPAREVT